MESLKRILMAVGIILVVGFILLPIISNPNHKPALNTICRLELANIKNAIDGYQSKYSNYPAGNQSEIIKSLCGDNLQKYQFLNIKVNQLNQIKNISIPGGHLSQSTFPQQIVLLFHRLAKIKFGATRTTQFSTASQTILW